jgi:hypothetical protein
MIDCLRVVDAALRGAERLIRKSQFPKHARKDGLRRHALVEVKANDVRAVDRRGVATQHMLDMPPRTGLVSQVIKRVADQSIADEQLARIGRMGGEAAELLGEFQRRPILPAVDAGHPQSPERTHLVVRVIKSLRELKDLCTCGLDLTPWAYLVQQRYAKRRK